MHILGVESISYSVGLYYILQCVGNDTELFNIFY